MSNKGFLFTIAILLFASNTFAGAKYKPAACSNSKKERNKKGAKTTMADAGEGNYDVKYLRFRLNVTDTSTYIQGAVATTAQVTATSMSDYVFELGSTINIDSAKVNGTLLPVTTTGFVRRITLPAALPAGTMFTAEIFYQGAPPSGAGFFNGVTHSLSAGGTHMMYTVSDPWVALNWWPCKQSVNDQIDSVDMYVTVPYGVADGSNGLLLNVDNTTTPGYSTYHWQTHYAIDYYLISIAVAKYGEYKSYMHFTGSADTMLIHNFFLDTAAFNPVYKANFDSLNQFIDYFSGLYGRYPFWQEKYGVCYTDLGGGMEHQTMTTIGVPGTDIIAHELAHQWFGDHVTYKTWGDMWLSEGFATFSEQLFLNHFWGAAAAKTHRQGYLSQALTQACGMTYVNDTTTSDSLFTTNQYQRAALIINTLRYMAPEDSLFFKVLRTYQSAYGFGNAGTADFKAIAESIYGFALDTFFNQWIYGRGFPVFKVSWNQAGSTVWVKLIQTRSCNAYNNHFYTPVQLALRSAAADTMVKVYSTIDTQVFSFNWSATMTGAALNPDVWTLCRQFGAITRDVTLGVNDIMPRNIKVHPNPSGNNWQIELLPEGTRLTLLDMNGRTEWQGISSKGRTTIPGERLPAGNYLLRLNGGTEESIKLTHW